MNIDNLTIEEIKNGYCYDIENNSYICNICSKVYEVGEVYGFDGRFFEASRAVKIHLALEHEDYFKELLNLESKYNTFTQNQKELLSLMYEIESDKEIAKILNISQSTVRHQRFMFREKAKQAKLFLAIYEKVMDKKILDNDRIVAVHNNATMVDDRYVVTEKEMAEILENSFYSLIPLKLKIFPRKEKKKIIILKKISEQLEPKKRYTEVELNFILKSIYEDYAVIRRYLVDYGFLERTKDSTEYWLK